jgi:hypothetical protein
MYRVMQALEREPTFAASSHNLSTEEGLNADEMPNEAANVKRSNPHKYLLYKPNVSQLLAYISSAFKVRA